MVKSIIFRPCIHISVYVIESDLISRRPISQLFTKKVTGSPALLLLLFEFQIAFVRQM